MSEQAAVQQSKAKSILDKGMFLSISRGWPQLSKAIPKEQIKDPALQSKNTHAYKDLFDSPELKAIYAHDLKLDNIISNNCLPFNVLKKGIFFLPKENYTRVENSLVSHASEREPLIVAIGEAYSRMKDDMKAANPALYDDNDYLSLQQFLARFKFRWHYLNFDVADMLEELDKTVAEREAQKMEEAILDAGNTFVYILLEKGKEIIDMMVDRLSPNDDGTNKTFHGKSINKAKEFFEAYKALNVTENKEFAELMETAKKLTEGLTPEQIRDNQALRDNLGLGFKKIKEDLDGMLVDAPSRMMRFD